MTTAPGPSPSRERVVGEKGGKKPNSQPWLDPKTIRTSRMAQQRVRSSFLLVWGIARVRRFPKTRHGDFSHVQPHFAERSVSNARSTTRWYTGTILGRSSGRGREAQARGCWLHSLLRETPGLPPAEGGMPHELATGRATREEQGRDSQATEARP